MGNCPKHMLFVQKIKMILCKVHREVFNTTRTMVFNNEGSVWTASYDEDWKVVHRKFTKTGMEFSKTRGSKYVQSYLGDAYTRIQEELKDDKWICFIGTTCQVYGLKQFLGKDYEN